MKTLDVWPDLPIVIRESYHLSPNGVGGQGGAAELHPLYLVPTEKPQVHLYRHGLSFPLSLIFGSKALASTWRNSWPKSMLPYYTSSR
jgi:hypothetical protein